MSINVTPIPTLDERINDIRLRTAAIINEHILPNEAALWNRGRSGEEITDDARAEARLLREQVKEKVRSEGLWAPHLPQEYGGMGLDFLAHAYMNEILAYAVGAASLFGVVAPNSGNQTILVQVRHRGAEAQVAAAAHRRDDGVRLLHDRARQPRVRPPLAHHHAPSARATSGSSTATSGSPRTARPPTSSSSCAGPTTRPASSAGPARWCRSSCPPTRPGVEHRARHRASGAHQTSDHCEVRYERRAGPDRQRAGRGRRRPPRPPRTASAPAASSTA